MAPRCGPNDLTTLQNWWSGAGSNRRPSAFQALYRALRPRTRTFRCPAHRHCRWSAAIKSMVATVPRCAGEFRFVCGVSVGITGRGRTCGDSVGPPAVAAGSSASPPLSGRASGHSDALITYSNQGLGYPRTHSAPEQSSRLGVRAPDGLRIGGGPSRVSSVTGLAGPRPAGHVPVQARVRRVLVAMVLLLGRWW